jgi:AcrR family transcriptional regulator
MNAMATSPTEDHRVRVARQRRTKMRRRLLSAVMATVVENAEGIVPTVDDVIVKADVSRATFYKYFSSVEEAIGLLGRELIDEMIEGLVALFGERNDPLFRMTTAIHLFLLRSVIDPQWATFVSRTAHLATETHLVEGIVQHLELAREQGFADFKNVQAAANVVVGSMLEAVRHIARTGVRDREHVEEVVRLILRALGLDDDQVGEIIRDRTIYIRGLAPDCLDWWRDPWAAA